MHHVILTHKLSRLTPVFVRGRVRAAARLAGLTVLFLAGLVHAEPLHHELRIVLDPAGAHIAAEDSITLPAALRSRSLSFNLHADLAVETQTPGARLSRSGSAGQVARWRVTLPAGTRMLRLRYSGRIPPSADPAVFDRSGIGTEGVYLDAGNHWFPLFGDALLTFRLHVTAPPGWRTVSQGKPVARDGAGGWEELQPQQDIHLVAGRFTVYQKPSPWGEAQLYLRTPDPALAATYLAATARYLELYSRLLGPYPYAKFALVENFWETGFGMPSFTLLGSRVLRLPFIPRTSYPHEILHSWWGNGVYVDLQTGNWSEGLTSYLADHLFAEEDGRGDEHRRAALQKYADYVAHAQDFPLSEFRARHSEATQAVGYGKALMFFHMLRLQLGDHAFVDGLRRFYRAQRHQSASYDDLRRALEAASGADLRAVFAQSVERTGAPHITVEDVCVERRADHYRIRGTVVQRQPGPAYTLRMPVIIETDKGVLIEAGVMLGGKRTVLDVRAPRQRGAPARVAFDPRFDVFRRLDPRELPPALSQLFGDKRTLFVLPAQAPSELRAAYRALTEGFIARQPGFTLAWDDAIETLPSDRPVWLLGWENRFRRDVARALGDRARLDDDAVRIADKTFERAQHAVMLAARRNDTTTLGWLGAPGSASLVALARKLPRYSQYSYLAFAGPDADNVLSGQWEVTGSPLIVDLQPAHAAPLIVPPRRPLTAILAEESGDLR